MLLNNLLSALLVFGLASSTPTPTLINSRSPSSYQQDKKTCRDYCKGTKFNQSLTGQYICGDFRLGPKRLPTRFPVFDIIDDYDRFGGLCPGEFLAKWYNPSTGFPNYPPLNGFQLNTAGAPIQGNITLAVGFLIDRFGSEFGSFASPEGAPYDQRALPPGNLNPPASDNRYPANYHVYRVLKPFDVLSGPIAGWFGQPGQGVQYQLYDSVINLLIGGFITPVALKDL